MTDVLVCIPVLGRPGRVQPLLESLRASQRDLELSPFFVASPGDADELRALRRASAPHWVVDWEPGPGDFARKTNRAFAQSIEDWFFAGADDLHFHPGWADEAVRVAEAQGVGMVGTDDLGNSMVRQGRHATHSLFRRSYIDECGGSADGPGVVYSEAYDHQYCNPGEAPIWMSDLSFRRLDEIEIGDEVIGWERIPAGKFTLNRLRESRVLGLGERIAPLAEVAFESQRTIFCTPDHLWLNADRNAPGRAPEWIPAQPGKKLGFVADPYAAEIDDGDERLAGWLGGIFDGEGSTHQIAQSKAVNPDLYRAICGALSHFGFDYKEAPDRIWLRGGMTEFVRFLNLAQPTKRQTTIDRVLGKESSNGAVRRGGRRFMHSDRIVSVDPGFSAAERVYSLTTETGNYVAWGYASKNCDTEAYEVAESRGCFAHAPGAVVEHLHPFWHKAQTDSTYEKGLANSGPDRALFLSRRKLWAP